MAEIPEPDYSDEKEVFAFYGLAAYKSQVLERAVMSLFVVFKLLLGEREFTQDVVDDYYAAVERKTMGAVFRRVRELRELPEDLEELVDEVVDRRNHLIHHFFWDHAENFLSDPGRREMLEALVGDAEFFQSAERRVREFIYSQWETLGISESDFEAALEEFATQALARETAV